ncbi:uncharacterized protein LOC113330694 [Papaver somniferum]|uniref:uncharacterized protein LOC113330694 n=1 Tax=Papaver somniferum TaxID=3469 RepID=UPI000E6F4730|nr:uncharacterized protein LOC113330694 [Papaver somniferum]
MHALVLCPFVASVWLDSSLCFPVHDFHSSTLLDCLDRWLVNATAYLSDDSIKLFADLIWSICNSRNNLIFSKKNKNPSHVISKARFMIIFRNPTVSASPFINVIGATTWMPPSPCWIKCNTDGAFDHVSLANGAGYIMRDYARKPSFCAPITFEVYSPKESETRAIWEVLKKAIELQLTHIIIESDAKTLIDQFSLGNFEGNQRTDALFKDISFF